MTAQAPGAPAVTTAALIVPPAARTRSRAALAAARLLHLAWTTVAGPVTAGSPSPCCRGERIARAPKVTGFTQCTGCGTLRPVTS